MMSSLPLRLLHALLPAALLVSVACKEEEEEPRAFEENGTWSLQEWAPDGADFSSLKDTTARRDAFLLRFAESKGFVAAAACSSPVDDPPDFSPASSRCNSGDADQDRVWDCKCFSYDWTTEFSHVWLGYEPDGGKPPNPNTADPEKTTTVSADTSDVENNIRLSPLPPELFDSDGESSVYLFQLKADRLMDETGCYEACGG